MYPAILAIRLYSKPQSPVTKFLFHECPSLQVWTAAATAFTSRLARRQEFFKAGCKATDFLPEPAPNNAAFWATCSQLTLPSAEFQALKLMAPLLGRQKDFSGGLGQNGEHDMSQTFLMEKLVNRIASFMAIVAETESQWGDAVPANQKAEQHSNLSTVAVQIAELLKEVSSSCPSPQVKDYIAKHVVTLAVTATNRVSEMLKNAVQSIPASYENLVESRNTTQIKAVMFNRKTHAAVTQNLEEIGKVCGNAEQLTQHFSMAGLLGAQHLATFKAIADNFKSLRTYTASTHGLNLILHKFGGKTARERAALNREQVGGDSKLCFVRFSSFSNQSQAVLCMFASVLRVGSSCLHYFPSHQAASGSRRGWKGMGPCAASTSSVGSTSLAAPLTSEGDTCKILEPALCQVALCQVILQTDLDLES